MFEKFHDFLVEPFDLSSSFDDLPALHGNWFWVFSRKFDSKQLKPLLNFWEVIDFEVIFHNQGWGFFSCFEFVNFVSQSFVIDVNNRSIF